MFLRSDVESLLETPSQKPHVIPGDQRALPAKENENVSALVKLTHEMHHELKKKETEIVRLSFELGKFQEIASNSVPLLEAKTREHDDEEKMNTLKKQVHSARFGRLLFFILFSIASGVIGILLHFLSFS
jgi:uncharacterized membrane protein